MAFVLKQIAVGRKLLRVPSFRMGYITSVVVVFLFLIWMLVDSEFPSTLHFSLVDLGVRGAGMDPVVVEAGIWDLMWRRAHRWNALGGRIFVFLSLGVVGCLSFATVAIRIFIGDSNGRTVLSWMLTVLLVCSWLGLYASYDRILWLGLRIRIERELPRFEKAAKPLIEEWPTENGALPEVGNYYAYPNREPEILLFPESGGYSMRESFGHMVSRTERGGLRFDLYGFPLRRVEYHPTGIQPSSHKGPSGELYGDSYYRLVRATRLGHEWFVTQYEVSKAVRDDSANP
jgi:hypothetical protein